MVPNEPGTTRAKRCGDTDHVFARPTSYSKPTTSHTMRSFSYRAARTGRQAGLLGLLFAGLALTPPLFAAEVGAVSTARDLFKDYIELRKLIGEESASWASQKISLADMVAVLKLEHEQLEAAIETLSGSATSADQKRAELNAQLEAGRALSTAFNATIADFEAQVKAIAARLPQPLVEELRPLLARLPENPAATRLSYSQRLQSLIGIMAQTDKFNSDIKYVSAVQTVGGESIEVQTLYFGLGAALYTDATGKHAGFGSPTADGWKWTPASPEVAPSIVSALDIYLSRKSPSFVSVPLQLD